jgi:hypothetical protein
MPIKKKEQEVAVVKEIRLETFPVKLVGDTPLIVHAWSDKARNEMLDKQMKKAKTGREARNPMADFINSLYWITPKPETEDETGFEKAVKKGAKFGFPSTAFKSAAASAGYRGGVMPNVVATHGAFHIEDELVEIKGTPVMREDMVRLSGINAAADIRFRGQFSEWTTTFMVRYNSMTISPEIIVNLFNLAGFSVGVGEWRPEKKGRFGMFHVYTGK